MRVVTILTGGVKSNIARVDHKLRPDSVYKPVEAEYNRRVKHSQEVGMDTQKYAASVVRQVTRRGMLTKLLSLFMNSNWIYEGSKSWLVWFVQMFMPRDFFVSWIYILHRCLMVIRVMTLMLNPAIQDGVMTRMFSLWKLRGGKPKNV